MMYMSLRKYNILLDGNVPKEIKHIVYVLSLMGINLRIYNILLDFKKKLKEM